MRERGDGRSGENDAVEGLKSNLVDISIVCYMVIDFFLACPFNNLNPISDSPELIYSILVYFQFSVIVGESTTCHHHKSFLPKILQLS